MELDLTARPLQFFNLILLDNFINYLENDFEDNLFYYKKYINPNALNSDFNSKEEYVVSFIKNIEFFLFQQLDSISTVEEISKVLNLTIQIQSQLKSLNDLKDKYKSELTSLLSKMDSFIQLNYSNEINEIEIQKNTSLYFVPNTIEFPFAFFQDLFRYNGKENLVKSFHFKTIYTRDYKLVSHYNEEFSFESWLLISDISYQLNFENYCKKVIYDNAIDSLKIIDNVYELRNIDFKGYINNGLNVLQQLMNLLGTANFEDYYDLENIITQISQKIKLKYNEDVKAHKIYRLNDLNQESNSSFIPLGQLKKSFFIELYDITLELDLIDDVETSEESFIDILMFSSTDVECKIKFIKANGIVSHYLKSIECFFENFTPISIQKSGKFYNKQNKILTSTDLYTSLNRDREKNLNYKEKINNSMNSLKLRYKI